MGFIEGVESRAVRVRRLMEIGAVPLAHAEAAAGPCGLEERT